MDSSFCWTSSNGLPSASPGAVLLDLLGRPEGEAPLPPAGLTGNTLGAPLTHGFLLEH